MNNGRQQILPNFVAGQVLTAQDLQSLRDVVSRMNTGSGQTFQTDNPPVAPVKMQMIVQENISQEYLTCRTWDGLNVGSTNIHVLKPPLLTKSYYIDGKDILGNTYVFDSSLIDTVVVTSEDGSTTETWAVTQSYNDEDIIFALANVRGGIDQQTSGELIWIDSNIDGRSWAVSA